MWNRKEDERIKFFAYETNGKLHVMDCFSGLSLDSILYNIRVERRLENMEQEVTSRAEIADDVTCQLDDEEIPYILLFVGEDGDGNLISNIDEDELIYMLEGTAEYLKDEKKQSLAEKIGDLFSWRKDIDEN